MEFADRSAQVDKGGFLISSLAQVPVEKTLVSEKELPKAKIKRKAKTSPGADSVSEEEKIGGNLTRSNPSSGKLLRPRKKRLQLRTDQASSPEGSAKQTYTDGSGPESSSNRRTYKTKSRVSLVISSDEEELDRDFAPQEYKIMGATNVGALGIDCLNSVESMRAKSKNLQGGVSGKMRKELERAKEIMNTLIFKAEAIGDPSFLKMKNKRES